MNIGRKTVRLTRGTVNRRNIICIITILFFIFACPGMPILAKECFNNKTDGMRHLVKTKLLNPDAPLAFKKSGRTDSANIFKVLYDKSAVIEFEPATPDKKDLEVDDTVIITPEIKAKALELEHDPVLIFYWVYNNIKVDFYYGSRGGSVGAFENMRGNSYDQCSLLIALLRAAGFSARYAIGRMELSTDELMQWTGANNFYAAANILYKRWNDVQQTQNGFSFEHIGVNVYNIYGEEEWNLLDPSYKIHEYEKTDVDISNEQILQSLTDSVQQVGDSLTVDSGSIEDALQAQLDHMVYVAEGMTIENLLGTRKIIEINVLSPEMIAQNVSIILQEAASGNYDIDLDVNQDGEVDAVDALIVMHTENNVEVLNDWTPTEEFSFLPEEKKAKIKIIMPGDNEIIMSASEVAGKELSIIYYEGTPVFRINGEVVISATESSNTVKIGSLNPWADEEWVYINKELLAGSRYSIASQMQPIAIDGLKEKEQANALKEKIANLGLGDFDQMPDDIQDECLSLLKQTYYYSCNKFIDDFSRKTEVDWVTEASFGFFSISSEGAIEIDIPEFTVSPVSLNQTQDDNKEDEIENWMATSGSIGSSFEHSTIEYLLGIESISTVKVFSNASEQNIPIIVLDNCESLEESLAKISADESIKSLIRLYVNDYGYTVMIPENKTTIGSWNGYGWLVMAPDFSSIGFQIQGGLNGGYSTEPMNETVVAAAGIAFNTWETLDTITITGTVAFAAGTKLYGAHLVGAYLMEQGLAMTLVGSGFLLGGLFVGTILLVATGVIFYTLISSIWGEHSSFIRRRRYDNIYYNIAYV